MNETTEKCSPARYARTILKVTIFLVKSDTVWYSLLVISPLIVWCAFIWEGEKCLKPLYVARARGSLDFASFLEAAERQRSRGRRRFIRFSTGSFLARVCSSKKNESFQNKRPKMRLKHSLILSLLLLVHRSLGKFIFYSFSMEKFLI